MKKRIFLWLSILNVSFLVFIAIIEFLILPSQTQRVLSTLVYFVAAFAGVIIGSLLSKIYQLRKKLALEKEELKKRVDNIQTYLTNVVHDLRSPLASINMISELLEEEVTGIQTIHSELISAVRKSSKAMLERICCILDNAEIEQNNNFEELVFDNPYPVLKSAVDKHHILAIDKNIDILLDVSPEIPSIYFNRVALDSIFSNLISNAIKYSMPKTKVRIFCNKENDTLVFSVKDQGLGMTKDDLSNVFGRYVKLSARPTRNEDSSGLGLSIVKDMAERMHGKVKAFSEGQGKGSTFSVFLSTSANMKTMTA